MKLTANKIAGILREHGNKLTPQRHMVLRVIAASHDHLTPEAIFEKSKKLDPAIGKVTVYRTLELLDRLGLVCKIHSREGCRSYMMRRPSEHHHHLICSDCGKVVDLTACDLIEADKKVAEQNGFTIKSHLLEFYGLCPDCKV